MPKVLDRVVWTGLNIRDVARVCRELLAWNRDNPTLCPAIWYTGRSRIEPEKNTVTLRTPHGPKTARVGDEVVRYEGNTFDVIPRPEEAKCRRPSHRPRSG